MDAATAFKRLGLAFAAAIIAAAGIVTALLLLVSTDAVREQAKAEIRAVTGLDPVFGGKATVSLFPSGTVSFEDVTFGDSKDPALSAKRLTARLRFFPLLIGRAETADISLDRPTIALVFGRDGRSNWTSLWQALLRGHSANQAALFSAIRIDDGRVILRDDAHNLNETFENVEMSLAWPAISRSFGATGHFLWRGQAADASLVLGDFADVLAGNKTGIKLRLGGALGKFAFDGSLSTQPTLRVTGALGADAPSLRQAIRWAGQKPPPGGGFERVALKAQMNIVGGTIALSSVNLELDGNSAEGVLTFAMDGRQTLQGTLAADTLDLRPYFSAVELMTANQREWSDGPITLEGLSSLDVDVRLSAASVVLGEAKVGRTALAANLRGGNLVVTIGESQAFGGIIKGAITLANLGSRMDVKSQLQFSNVDLDSCLSQLFKLRRIEGKGNLALLLEGSGASVLAVTRTLNGTANLVGTNGALVGLNVEQLLRRLERRPLSAGAELRTGRTPYDRIAVALKITDGQVNVQDVKIDGAAVKLALGGTASIPSRGLDLTGTATLLASSGAGGFELPFVVQGSWDDPLVLPDTQLLIRRSGAAEPLLNAVRGRSARDTVRSAIERLTGQPASAPADGAQPRQ